MSSDVLVCRVKEAAQAANWSMLHRYLTQYMSALPPHSADSASDEAPAAPGDGARGVKKDDRHTTLSTKSDQDPWIQRAGQDRADVINIALYALQAGDFQARWDLSKVIPGFGVVAIAPLIAMLDDTQDDDDWELAWFIARILGAYPCPEAILALSDLLCHTSEPDVIAIAADALASMGEAAIPSLAALTQNPSTRLAAVQALAQIHHASAADSLITVIDDDDPAVRAVAIAALGHIHHPQVIEVLMQALRDQSSAVRRAAIVGLSLQRDSVSEAAFLAVTEPLLWDINLDVRRQTILALSRLKSATAATILFDALCSKDTPNLLNADILRALIWTETQNALQTLHALTHMVIGQANVTSAYVPRLDNQVPSSRPPNPLYIERLQPPEVRSQFLCDVAMTLGLVERNDLREVAAEILADILQGISNHHHPVVNSGAVKQAIAHSLGHLGQMNAIPDLTGLLDDPDQRVRLHTANALKKILGDACFA